MIGKAGSTITTFECDFNLQTVNQRGWRYMEISFHYDFNNWASEIFMKIAQHDSSLDYSLTGTFGAENVNPSFTVSSSQDGFLGHSLVGLINSFDVLMRENLTDTKQLQKRIADNGWSNTCRFCNHLGFCLLYDAEIYFDFATDYRSVLFFESKFYRKHSIDIPKEILRTKDGVALFDNLNQLQISNVEINPYTFSVEVWFKPFALSQSGAIWNLRDGFNIVFEVAYKFTSGKHILLRT